MAKTREENEQKREPTREKEGRKKRIPMTGLNFKLNFERFKGKNDGYEYRVFEDRPGRLEAAQDAWWEFVTEDTGKSQGEGANNERDMTTARVRKIVGYRADGTPKMGYLMRIKKEYYNEDKAAKEASRKQIEKRIKKGANPTGEEALDGRYIPEEGISIEHGKGRVRPPDT